VLSNLENQTAIQVLDFESVKNGRELALIELNVDDGTNDGTNLSRRLCLRSIASYKKKRRWIQMSITGVWIL
jgi:hypothetical protein